MSSPAFHSVLDLGLRDVGVANQPRRFAAHLGCWSVPAVAVAVAFAFGSCVLVRSAGASPPLVAAVGLAVMFALALRIAKRSPVVVVKVTADGRNQATWMVAAPFLLALVPALVYLSVLAIPVAVIAVAAAALVWRERGRAPTAVRTLRSALAAGEPVLGDGFGLAQGAKRRRDALRVIAATDRRLLAANEARVLLDVPYGDIDRFGVAWRLRGQWGTLSLSTGEATYVISSIAPANLLSIAQALRAHGVHPDDPGAVDDAQRAWGRALRRAKRRRASRGTRIAGALLAVVVGLVATASAAGFDLASLPVVVQEVTGDSLPVDGRSNLTGGAAALSYTRGPGLRELRTDEDWGAGPNDGARWELRTSFTKGYNVVSLAHYVFVDPRLDDPASVAEFVAGKDREHARLAGSDVEHTERVVDGRRGYVWEHGGRRGYWHFVAWFPQPEHTVRVECIAKKQAERFKRLCAEAMASLRFQR